MSFAIYNLVVKLLLVTSLLVPGAQNLLQGQNLADVQASYAQSLDQRALLVNQLEQREAEYRALLGQVDVLKNGLNTLQNRMELEGLLRDSRMLAEEMQALQQKIRAADTRLSNQRGQLVAAIDGRMKAIEARLAEGSQAERRELVSTLNDLRAERRRFTEPLPSAPTDGEVNETLAMIEELKGASAADLLAAADELQDTEDQVRKRLDAIQGRIAQLRRAKTLARRARSFAAEERFFDETDRSRFIAGFERSRSNGAPSSGAESSDGASNDGEAGGSDDFGETGGGNRSPTEPADEVAGEGESESPDPGFVSDANTDGDFAAAPGGSDSLSDQPQSPSSAPERQGSGDPSSGDPDSGDQGRAQQDDVFGAGDDLLVDSQSNPQRAVGTGFESDFELDSRIERLESEQRRLQEQARDLEKEAGELRKRARDSLD